MIADVVAATASVTLTNVSELRGRRSVRTIARPRQVAMDVSVAYTGRRIADVARYFGRHHSTVRGAVNAVAGRIENGDDDTATMRAQILATLPDVVANRLAGAGHARV